MVPDDTEFGIKYVLKSRIEEETGSQLIVKAACYDGH